MDFSTIFQLLFFRRLSSAVVISIRFGNKIIAVPFAFTHIYNNKYVCTYSIVEWLLFYESLEFLEVSAPNGEVCSSGSFISINER